MSRILANIFQNLSLLSIFIFIFIAQQFPPYKPWHKASFVWWVLRTNYINKLVRTQKEKGKNINIGFCVNGSVKISKVRGYQLCFDSRVILQSARFIQEQNADGFIRGVETISFRKGCNSAVSENIPWGKSLKNAPRFLGTKVSIQVFSILIGNYFKRHSLNNFH